MDSNRFGFGFSTIGFTGINGPSLTGLYDLNADDVLQGFFSVPQTSPFEMGFALLFKHTTLKSQTSGFHLGGGIGLSNLTNVGLASSYMGMNFTLVAGFHFEIPGVPSVVVHLDGGPSYQVLNTNPSQTSLQIGPLSAALGASILYHF